LENSAITNFVNKSRVTGMVTALF